MKRFFGLLFTVAAVLVLTINNSCKGNDDDIPNLDTVEISKAEILGGWGVVRNDIYWNLTSSGNLLNNTCGFKSKVQDIIDNKTNYVSFFFTDSILFYVRHRPDEDPEFPYYIRQSGYHMNNGDAGYYIILDNELLMADNFPTNTIYLKKDENNQLVFYLKRSQIISALEQQSDLKSIMSSIRKGIDNIEVDITTARDTLDYEYIFAGCADAQDISKYLINNK